MKCLHKPDKINEHIILYKRISIRIIEIMCANTNKDNYLRKPTSVELYRDNDETKIPVRYLREKKKNQNVVSPAVYINVHQHLNSYLFHSN